MAKCSNAAVPVVTMARMVSGTMTTTSASPSIAATPRVTVGNSKPGLMATSILWRATPTAPAPASGRSLSRSTAKRARCSCTLAVLETRNLKLETEYAPGCARRVTAANVESRGPSLLQVPDFHRRDAPFLPPLWRSPDACSFSRRRRVRNHAAIFDRCSTASRHPVNMAFRGASQRRACRHSVGIGVERRSALWLGCRRAHSHAGAGLGLLPLAARRRCAGGLALSTARARNVCHPRHGNAHRRCFRRDRLYRYHHLDGIALRLQQPGIPHRDRKS